MPDSPLSRPNLYPSLCQALTGAPWSSAGWTAADWEAFTALAIAEGVAPLLYSAWKPHGYPPGLPAGQQARFQQAYLQSAGRNLLYLGELEKIRQAFAAQHIDCLPLKGAALAGTLYPDPATRPMSDLDLLVHPAQLRPALGVLRRLGYSLENFTYHAILWGAAPVELHWSLPYAEQPRAQPPEPWFWEQSAGRPRAGAPYAAWLLHAIAHLQVQNRGQGRLLNYFDLLRLAQSLGGYYDWPGLHAQAEAFGWGAAYTAALHATARRFPYHFPAAALPSKAAPPAVAGAQTALPAPPSDFSPRDRYTAAAWQHLDAPTRLQAGFSLLFPGRGYMLWRFRPRPAWLWPLWYPVRWGSLVKGLKA